MPMQVTQQLLTETQTAAYLGCSKSWLAKCRMEESPKDAPAPPFVRLGARAIRYDLSELQKFIAQHSVNRQPAS